MATASTEYVLFDQFVPEILQYAPGAPTIMVRTHIRNSIIDFLERSMILLKSPSSFALDSDESTYSLKYSGDRYRAVAIKGDARLGEGSSATYIPSTTRHEIQSWSGGQWYTETGSKPTLCFLTEETNKIRFFPIPNQDSDDDIYLTTAVTLRRDQTEIDEWVWEKWEEPIQAGALASILSVNNASWANARLASTFTFGYKRGLKRARAVALKGTGEFSGRVTPQNFEVMGADYTGEGNSEWV